MAQHETPMGGVTTIFTRNSGGGGMAGNFNRRWKCLSICALAALFSMFVVVSCVQAQSASTGGLTGTVTDPSGGSISGATVTATSLGTGQSRTTTTDASGSYK